MLKKLLLTVLGRKVAFYLTLGAIFVLFWAILKRESGTPPAWEYRRFFYLIVASFLFTLTSSLRFFLSKVKRVKFNGGDLCALALVVYVTVMALVRDGFYGFAFWEGLIWLSVYLNFRFFIAVEKDDALDWLSLLLVLFGLIECFVCFGELFGVRFAPQARIAGTSFTSVQLGCLLTLIWGVAVANIFYRFDRVNKMFRSKGWKNAVDLNGLIFVLSFGFVGLALFVLPYAGFFPALAILPVPVLFHSFFFRRDLSRPAERTARWVTVALCVVLVVTGFLVGKLPHAGITPALTTGNALGEGLFGSTLSGQRAMGLVGIVLIAGVLFFAFKGCLRSERHTGVWITALVVFTLLWLVSYPLGGLTGRLSFMVLAAVGISSWHPLRYLKCTRLMATVLLCVLFLINLSALFLVYPQRKKNPASEQVITQIVRLTGETDQ